MMTQWQVNGRSCLIQVIRVNGSQFAPAGVNVAWSGVDMPQDRRGAFTTSHHNVHIMGEWMLFPHSCSPRSSFMAPCTLGTALLHLNTKSNGDHAVG